MQEDRAVLLPDRLAYCIPIKETRRILSPIERPCQETYALRKHRTIQPLRTFYGAPIFLRPYV